MNSIFALVLAALTSFGHGKPAPYFIKPVSDVKFGALAINVQDGTKFGWASNCDGLADAERKAIKNCENQGGNCAVVIAYSGSGCAVYRVNSDGRYGWGVATTQKEADQLAIDACIKNSGKYPDKYVWSCNTESTEKVVRVYTTPYFKSIK